MTIPCQFPPLFRRVCGR